MCAWILWEEMHVVFGFSVSYFPRPMRDSLFSRFYGRVRILRFRFVGVGRNGVISAYLNMMFKLGGFPTSLLLELRRCDLDGRRKAASSCLEFKRSARTIMPVGGKGGVCLQI